MSETLAISIVVIVVTVALIAIGIILRTAHSRDDYYQDHSGNYDQIEPSIRNALDGDSQGFRHQSHPRKHLSPEEAFGIHGEEQVFKMLFGVGSSCGGYAYRSFALMDADGYCSEIDAVLICKGGFFVVEVKAQTGFIKGNLDDDEWVSIKGDYQEAKPFRNPIKQNQGHINHLRKMMGSGAPKMTSLIVFPFTEVEPDPAHNVYDLISAHDYLMSEIAKNKYKPGTVDRFKDQLSSILSKYRIDHDTFMEWFSRRNEA